MIGLIKEILAIIVSLLGIYKLALEIRKEKKNAPPKKGRKLR